MLKIIRSTGELNMNQLLTVYAESIVKAGMVLHPNLSEWEQLRICEDEFREDVFSFMRMDNTCIAVWLEGEMYVAALRLEPYADGALLTCLETAPHFRGVGKATALVSAVLENCDGVLYSHVHKNNGKSLALHMRTGFKIISDNGKLLDGTVSNRYYTLRYGF